MGGWVAKRPTSTTSTQLHGLEKAFPKPRPKPRPEPRREAPSVAAAAVAVAAAVVVAAAVAKILLCSWLLGTGQLCPVIATHGCNVFGSTATTRRVKECSDLRFRRFRFRFRQFRWG